MHVIYQHKKNERAFKNIFKSPTHRIYIIIQTIYYFYEIINYHECQTIYMLMHYYEIIVITSKLKPISLSIKRRAFWKIRNKH